MRAPMLVIALLVATAAAFVVSERLKLTPSPILDTQVDRSFSPTCSCPTAIARLSFRLRKADRLTIAVVKADSVVRNLVRSRRFGPGVVGSAWNGREDGGRLAPDGSYLIRVHLAHARRTIVLPNPITLDTRAPRAELVAIRPRRFSPDGDHRADRVEISYRFDEVARPYLLIDGRVRVIGRFAYRSGQLTWYGKVGSTVFPAGRYRISVAGRDLAGNLSAPAPAKTVEIRFIALARHTISAAPGRCLEVSVSTDALRFHWRFAGRSGTALARRPLALRAPTRLGRYRLTVSERGHSAQALITIR